MHSDKKNLGCSDEKNLGCDKNLHRFIRLKISLHLGSRRGVFYINLVEDDQGTFKVFIQHTLWLLGGSVEKPSL